MKKKAVTGIFFILSCFAAMFVLLEFHDNYLFVGIAALLLLVSSFCFLNALFAEKSKEWGALEENEENLNGFSGRHEEEFKKNVINYMEAMNHNQAQMLQELKSQKQVMTAQMKSLENKISSLSEKQMFQTKTVVKYNKENARQLALNEKKVVEQAVKELKEVMTEYASRTAAAPLVAVTEEPKMPVMEDVVIPEVTNELPIVEDTVVPEEMPIELPIVEETIIPEVATKLPKAEDMAVPEMSPELPSMEEMQIPELPPMEDLELPVLDDIVVAEEPPAPPVVDSDPNKMMTPDDIAKLLASMGM